MSRRRTVARRLSCVLAVVAVAAAVQSAPATAAPAPPTPTAAAAVPSLTVSTVVSGLSHPWDLAFLPDRTMLFNERGGAVTARLAGGTTRTLDVDTDDLFVGSETGMMGMVLDPGFATNRTLYTCQGYEGTGDTPLDIRVVKWTLNSGVTALTKVGPIVTGLPISSGRHGGCRLRFDNSNRLYIGTGDAAQGTNPQNLASLGGKVLRVTTSGAPAAGNPYLTSTNSRTKLIYTYGHRNVQGLALRPGTNDMWSVEQGSGVDDEVNRLVARGNYGWNPVPGPTGSDPYNESVPMTDTTKYPSAQRAIYTTGASTLALSGGTFLSGPQWGAWNGAFAAAALKDTSLRVVTDLTSPTTTTSINVPQLDNTYGRLRSPLQGPDGALYIATGNGSNDRIVKVTPGCTGPSVTSASTTGLATSGGATRIFVKATDNSVRYTTVNPVTGRFSNLGGAASYGPSAVTMSGNRTDVFITGTNGHLYQKFLQDGRWTPRWIDHGGFLTSSPTVVSFASRQLTVLARGGNSTLYTKRFTGSAWTPWTAIGGVFSGAPGAAIDGGSGVATVGVRRTDGTLLDFTLDRNGGRTPSTSTGITSCSSPSYSGLPAGDGTYRAYTGASGNVILDVAGRTVPIGGSIVGTPTYRLGEVQQDTSSYVVTGRGPGDALWYYDSVPGTWRSLGGSIR